MSKDGHDYENRYAMMAANWGEDGGTPRFEIHAEPSMSHAFWSAAMDALGEVADCDSGVWVARIEGQPCPDTESSVPVTFKARGHRNTIRAAVPGWRLAPALSTMPQAA